MKLRTSRFAEHQTSGRQEVFALPTIDGQVVVPGACTSCNGSTSTSCCCATFNPTGGKSPVTR